MENKLGEIPCIPDEACYPAQMTDQYEILECLSAEEETQTILMLDRVSGNQVVAKCFTLQSPLFERSEPAALQELNVSPLPRFVSEYANEQLRCVLREYVPGDTLAELAAHRQFSEDEIIRIGIQLCDQLTALHTNKPPIIHRDIKPQNVIIRPDGVAVLIDFGISRVYTESATDTVAFGTQGFAPPEQYGFSQTDGRSDIYSLGILLHWLLSGETVAPKKADSPLKKVIARCAAFDPRNRYADAAQVKHALLQARPKVRKRRYLLYALAALVLMAGLITCAVLLPRGHEASPVFTQPLIEEAVRLQLGLDENAALTEEVLTQVTAVYIVADTAYPDQDAFYPAINQWYADGKPARGNITALDDLKMLPNLEQVCIVAQELDDISALAGLEKLNKVELKHNYITDISPLSGMGRLTSVGINDNPVRDISPLAQCPNLAFLDLCDVRSYDPSVIAELGNFDFLDISNPTESYRYLEGKSILDLRIAWTGLDDLTVLDSVTRLEQLEIDHTDVVDLSPLLRHTGLKVLKISGLPVTDFRVLLDLPQLREVTISEEMRPALEALGELSFTVKIE